MSNNTRQPTGRTAAPAARADRRGGSGYQWTADSDWLRPPPVPASQRRSATTRAGSGHQGPPLDRFLPGGLEADPHDDDRLADARPVEELFPDRGPEWSEPLLAGVLDHADDDFGFRPSPLDHLRRLRSRWVLAGVVAVVMAAVVAVVILQSRDGDNNDLAAVGASTTSTTAAAAGTEPGVDTVRTGPGLTGTTDESATESPAAVPGPPESSTADDDADDDGDTNAGATANGTGEPDDADGDSSTDSSTDGSTGSTGDTTGAEGTPAAGAEGAPGAPAPGAPAPNGSAARPELGADYGAQLALIRGQTVRNRTEDDSPYRQTPSDQLVPENHYGPRSDYLQVRDGNVEPAFPVQYGGQFRVACEFSHFAYDDPLVYPNQPGASHLHMFFGNTDTNAFSTADSIKNSGGSTCNGNELNRTGYWVPAMFDGSGNVRIPERVVVYYKGEGLANGKAEVFPDGAAMIASVDLNTVAPAQGGAAGKFSYNCSNNYSGFDDKLSNTMPNCVGTSTPAGDMYSVLEVNVKFPQCWNGQDPGNPANFRHPTRAGWYGSLCDGAFNRTLVNLEYFVNYRVEPGETTQGWYLSSDVSPTERVLAHTPGSTNHGDWWSGWHTGTNKMFIDNCVNYSTSAPSGCGFGYLTDGGPDNGNPRPGPALKLRDQYLGPQKVPAADVYAELCPGGGTLSSPTAAAFCNPAASRTSTSAPGGAPPAHSPNALFCPVHRGMLASDPASPVSGGGVS
ncbi:MAG: DUF1996 domain-containing protein [Actinomycetota bacterium]